MQDRLRIELQDFYLDERHISLYIVLYKSPISGNDIALFKHKTKQEAETMLDYFDDNGFVSVESARSIAADSVII